MLNASHIQMNRAALSAESTNSTPPFTAGWFATNPTTWPASRPNPVTPSGAYDGLSSKNESASAIASITWWMSNPTLSSAGTRSRANGRAAGAASYDGGAERQQPGT